ncbi:hypothetical protein F2P81_003425 [Scophthalmus maximus]|uniref:Uncharacterized protein n=1 Tax=Scophthalmus maximus TaxID=52904 RepID=A0A6A4TCP0_SCOMX|nr:hypothetical protein F2P81_003425 [Scophthalmus maximus]
MTNQITLAYDNWPPSAITKSDLNYAYTKPDVYPHWNSCRINGLFQSGSMKTTKQWYDQQLAASPHARVTSTNESGLGRYTWPISERCEEGGVGGRAVYKTLTVGRCHSTAPKLLRTVTTRKKPIAIFSPKHPSLVVVVVDIAFTPVFRHESHQSRPLGEELLQGRVLHFGAESRHQPE